MELSAEQEKAKNEIVQEITSVLAAGEQKCRVLLVSGSAGTGKTVLVSSVFFALRDLGVRAKLLVNHKELRNMYQEQYKVWSLSTDGQMADGVSGADDYIKACESGNNFPCEVVLVDEAHLLFSGPFMNTIKSSQLTDLVENCDVLVMMIDPDQYVKRATMIDQGKKDQKRAAMTLEEKYQHLLGTIAEVQLVCNLTKQFRMGCTQATAEWIRSIPTEGANGVAPFPYEAGNYTYEEIRDGAGRTLAYTVSEKNAKNETAYVIGIFPSLVDMSECVEKHKQTDNPSALIASYCWKQEYSSPDKPFIKTDTKKWFWHKTGSGSGMGKNGIWTLANTMKAKNDPSAYEVGAFHDIQGFDLNYAGVILGKSILYVPQADGTRRIQFALGRNSKNEEGRRDLKESDPWQTLIKNEICVLLTRGMKGLYIYAMDNQLREALIQAVIPKP